MESRDLARGSGRETTPRALVNARGATVALRVTDDPDPGFGHALALEARGQMAGAHRAYVAVLARDGNVVIFEANATMALALPEDEPQNAERRGAVERITTAFRRTLSRLR